MKKFSLFLIGLILLAGAGFFGTQIAYDFLANRQEISDYEQSRQLVPETTSRPETITKTPSKELASSLNYELPFIVQAPFGNWDERHEEFCEEASLVMAAYYTGNKTYTDLETADQLMNTLADWQIDNFGFFESTNNAETLKIAQDVLGLDASLETATISSIKQALNDGKLVLVPAAGRELGNPFFQNPGPIYHMLVVKGYTKDGQFVTHDPGTKNGADYLYDEQVLFDAIGEYQHADGSVDTTVKEVLIIN